MRVTDGNQPASRFEAVVLELLVQPMHLGLDSKLILFPAHQTHVDAVVSRAPSIGEGCFRSLVDFGGEG
jgi:hypothetical protein